MTNLDYIKSIMTDRLAANLFFNNSSGDNFQWKVIRAFNNWADRFGDHKGNVVNEKGNPSIWSFEWWHYPDGRREKKGQPRNVAFQTWLGHQYNKDDWA